MPSYQSLVTFFQEAIPQARDLGFCIDHIEQGQVSGHADFQPFMIGNPEDQLLNGGILSTLIDNISGITAFTTIGTTEAVVTLDLRIDYMRPAVADQTIHVSAECYRKTANIVFIKAAAWQQADKPVAHSVSTFMLANPQLAAP